MIENLKYTTDFAEWSSESGPVRIELEDIKFVYQDKHSESIFVSTGKKLPDAKRYYFSETGVFQYMDDIEQGQVIWSTEKGNQSLCIEGLIDAGFFPHKNIILFLYQTPKWQELLVLNRNGEYLFELYDPPGYTMKYFSEFSDYISVVCDGDENHVDKFGRNRFHFELDLELQRLYKKGLAY